MYYNYTWNWCNKKKPKKQSSMQWRYDYIFNKVTNFN